jgi:hypothetical protein
MSAPEVAVSLADVIRANAERSFDLYGDLAAALTHEHLGSHLSNVRSNTVGQQLWCVVGARESYTRGIRAGKWAGFACSLSSATDLDGLREALARSRRDAASALAGIEGFSDTQLQLVCDLLEHEAQHHGQLIRYIYALGIEIPPRWKARYALD